MRAFSAASASAPSTFVVLAAPSQPRRPAPLLRRLSLCHLGGHPYVRDVAFGAPVARRVRYIPPPFTYTVALERPHERHDAFSPWGCCGGATRTNACRGAQPIGTWGATPGHPPPSGSAIEGRAPFESSACVSSLQSSACVSSPSVSALHATPVSSRNRASHFVSSTPFSTESGSFVSPKKFVNFENSDLSGPNPSLWPRPTLRLRLPRQPPSLWPRPPFRFRSPQPWLLPSPRLLRSFFSSAPTPSASAFHTASAAPAATAQVSQVQFIIV